MPRLCQLRSEIQLGRKVKKLVDDGRLGFQTGKIKRLKKTFASWDGPHQRNSDMTHLTECYLRVLPT